MREFLNLNNLEKLSAVEREISFLNLNNLEKLSAVEREISFLNLNNLEKLSAVEREREHRRLAFVRASFFRDFQRQGNVREFLNLNNLEKLSAVEREISFLNLNNLEKLSAVEREISFLNLNNLEKLSTVMSEREHRRLAFVRASFFRDFQREGNAREFLNLKQCEKLLAVERETELRSSRLTFSLYYSSMRARFSPAFKKLVWMEREIIESTTTKGKE